MTLCMEGMDVRRTGSVREGIKRKGYREGREWPGCERMECSECREGRAGTGCMKGMGVRREGRDGM